MRTRPLRRMRRCSSLCRRGSGIHLGSPAGGGIDENWRRRRAGHGPEARGRIGHRPACWTWLTLLAAKMSRDTWAVWSVVLIAGGSSIVDIGTRTAPICAQAQYLSAGVSWRRAREHARALGVISQFNHLHAVRQDRGDFVVLSNAPADQYVRQLVHVQAELPPSVASLPVEH